ncbi:hypothetical protein ACE1OE_11695 [Vibrio sp. E150_011]
MRCGIPLEAGQCEPNALINDRNDDRNDVCRGITALSYLQSNDRDICRDMENFLAALKSLAPDQYYHPQDELQLTILSIISYISKTGKTAIPFNPWRVF